jgi:hypothetical protein
MESLQQQHYLELKALVEKSTADSQQLLQLESLINNAVEQGKTNNVFGFLASMLQD